MNAALIKFEIKDFPELNVVGKEIIVAMAGMRKQNPIPEFWKKSLTEKIFVQLEKNLKDYIYDPAYAGFMKIINEKEFTYVCGFMVKPGAPVPQGYVSYKVEPFTGGIGWIQGIEPDIYITESSLTEKAAGDAGYEYDSAKDFSLELYNDPRFTKIDENGNRIVDYCMPVKKK